VVNKIHQRSLNSIATSRINLDWKRICYSFFLWSTVTIVIIFMDYSFNPENFQWNFKPKQFLIMLLIALSLIPIQTSLEEFIFRGYLMQGFGSLFKNTWAPLILTSVIFGVLHIFNPEVEKLGYNIMFYYIGTGLFLGIMTLMDDGIELSLGFHAANNLITVILVTANWTAFQTESLFISISEPDLGSEIITSLFILYPLFLFIMAKKYNWSNWMKRLVHSF
jgi:membrane protease YdiL (CAAX protease family)